MSNQGWADHGKRIISASEWKRLRKAALKRDQNRCQLLMSPCTGTATEVDHIQPVYLAPHLQGVLSNLMSVCKPCHDIKSRQEAIDGARRARAKAKHPDAFEQHPGLLIKHRNS